MDVVAQTHVESSWTGIEPMSHALTGGFLSIAPPGKVPYALFGDLDLYLRATFWKNANPYFLNIIFI